MSWINLSDQPPPLNLSVLFLLQNGGIAVGGWDGTCYSPHNVHPINDSDDTYPVYCDIDIDFVAPPISWQLIP